MSGSPNAAEALVRCYAHHRYWATAFNLAAQRLGAGRRRAKADSLSRHCTFQMERYGAHLQHLNAVLPATTEPFGDRLVRWLVIHCNGLGLRLWERIAALGERRLRRVVLRLHGINPSGR